MDIWYQGVNVARDPGTYLYNAKPPWNNALSGAWCHNTLILDDQEPMITGGRFLWLDWSEASLRRYPSKPDANIEVLYAFHRAGRRANFIQQRSIARLGSSILLVADDILGRGSHQVTLNWNLADLPWEIENETLELKHEAFISTLTWKSRASIAWGLFRAGERVAGLDFIEATECYGWHADTYADRVPGLQLVMQLNNNLPIRVVSEWTFSTTSIDHPEVNWHPIAPDTPAFKNIRWGSEEWTS
jgi:hypothetical protein